MYLFAAQDGWTLLHSYNLTKWPRYYL